MGDIKLAVDNYGQLFSCLILSQVFLLDCYRKELDQLVLYCADRVVVLDFIQGDPVVKLIQYWIHFCQNLRQSPKVVIVFFSVFLA